MGIIRTGKFLDEAVSAGLRRSHDLAQRVPAIVVGDRHLGPYGRTEAEKALEHVKNAIDEACVAAGMPEPEKDADGDVIHYGVDFATREILLWDGKL